MNTKNKTDKEVKMQDGAVERKGIRWLMVAYDTIVYVLCWLALLVYHPSVPLRNAPGETTTYFYLALGYVLFFGFRFLFNHQSFAIVNCAKVYRRSRFKRFCHPSIAVRNKRRRTHAKRRRSTRCINRYLIANRSRECCTSKRIRCLPNPRFRSRIYSERNIHFPFKACGNEARTICRRVFKRRAIFVGHKVSQPIFRLPRIIRSAKISRSRIPHEEL